EHRLLVDPSHAALALGPVEAALLRRDEPQADEVDLAGLVGVGATVGEVDERSAAVRSQDGGAVPHPVLALCGVERVEVEHGLPPRVRLAVLLERRPTPQTS